jgi:hypothetical protein
MKQQPLQPKFTGAIICASLTLTDGSSKIIEVKMPYIDSSMDAYWSTTLDLTNTISRLAAYHMPISGYYFSLLLIMSNGSIANAGQSPLYEIPLNKVWHEKKGWITIKRARQLARAARA